MKRLLSKIANYSFRYSKLPASLRTHKDEAEYCKAKNNGYASKTFNGETHIKKWNHWVLIKNKFPYSAAFKKHNMLVPKRQIIAKQFSKKERNELDLILDELSDEYDCMLINFNKKQSVKDHFHIHLLCYKEKRRDIKL